MTTWIKQLERLPKRFAAPLCLVIVALVGAVDYLTGYETFFFSFYLLGVFLGVWAVGVSFGILISALSVMTWISTNVAAGEHYPNYFVPVWNALILFVFYLVVVFLLARLKKFQNELEERVRLRTESLTREISGRVRLQKELLEISEREQRRIGHELHDSLCQHLTGTALAGHLTGQKLAEKSLPEAAEVSRLVALIEEAIELTRTLSRGLSPVEMQAAVLADNFRELAANASERFKIECRFEGHEAERLRDANAATHFYRIAQEAISNAVRHGKAKRVSICLDTADDEIVLTVADDGSGLPENARNGGGMGLRIMAYRADLIGASFNIERLPGRGTRVTCALPTSPMANENHDAKN